MKIENVWDVTCPVKQLNDAYYKKTPKYIATKIT